MVVCKELEDVDNLFANGAKRVLDIVTLVKDSEENNQSFTDFSTEFSDLTPEQQRKPLEAMKIARSCLLLQFAVAILLLFESQES